MADTTPYQRDKLYEEVWSEPVTAVAKKYGVSDVAIHKVCKRLTIPVPPRGYWARIAAGQTVAREPLPPSDGPTTAGRFNKDAALHREPRPVVERLSYLDASQKSVVMRVCGALEVREKLIRPHPLIKQDQELRKERKRRQREDRHRTSYEGYDYDYWTRSFNGLPTAHVDVGQLQRAYRLLDAIFRAVETLGGTIRQDDTLGNTQVALLGETMRIRIRNRGDVLALSIEEYDAPRKNWKDTKTKRLEGEAGSFVMGLFDCANALRVDREERRLDADRKRQAMMQQILKEEQVREEKERLQVLEEAAADWQKARMIEQYVDGLEKLGQTETDERKRKKLLDYVAWARQKILWLDPLTAGEDPILERRWYDESDDEDEP